MERFEGCKFRPTGRQTITHNTHTNEIEYKDEFVPTSSYIRFLEQQYLTGLEVKAKRLKTRLDNEVKEYGECDPIEFKRYLNLLDKIYSLSHKPKKEVAKSGKLQPMKTQIAPQPYLPKPAHR